MRSRFESLSGVTVINDGMIYGGVNFIQEINPTPDLMFGNVVSAELKVDIGAEYLENIRPGLDQYLSWWCQMNDGLEEKLMGYFKVYNIEYNGSRATLTLYDYVKELDAESAGIGSYIQYPITLNQLLKRCSEFFNFNYKTTNIDDFAFQSLTYNGGFNIDNSTRRQLLGYIAQAVSANIIASPTAPETLQVLGYVPFTNTTFGLDKYVSFQDKLEVPAISSLIVQSSFDDIGYRHYGNEEIDNPYIILENPMFFTAKYDSMVQFIVGKMYDKLYNYYPYTPGKLTLLGDYNVNCGHIITVETFEKYCEMMVMKKTISPSGVVLECYGEQQREQDESEVKSGIVMLNNKMNEFYQTLDETRSTITKIEANFDGEISTLNTKYSEILQTADEIRGTVRNQNSIINGLGQEVGMLSNDVSEVKQTATEISTTVSNQVSRLDGEMEVLEGSISEVKQTAESIKLSVDSNGKTASITIGGQTFTVINPEGVEEEVNGINLDGYVTFTALSANGQSSIHGGNIITQTIDADDINMTGRIAWGDLTDEVQTQINSGNLPGYIKDTYIDFTQVNSPYIRGNSIELRGGTFDIKDATGATRYGYIGKGNGHDGTAKTDGVILSYSGSTGLGTGDYYIICTSKGVRLQAGNSSIYVTANGCFTETNGQGDVEIGTCIFG